MEKEQLIANKLNDLKKSKFRSSFYLRQKDIDYIDKVGFNKITDHAYNLISSRIAKKEIINDGKQTPMKGHPVFVAQHATATCCRGCLYKWHHIAKNKELNQNEKNYIVTIIMQWIENEYRWGKWKNIKKLKEV